MVTKKSKNTDLHQYGQVVLVFQGGGALGAYQLGIYEALHDAGIEPDWIIGTSIGAINAALIAGNAPEHRMDKLNAFWNMVQSPHGDPYNESVQPLMQNLMNMATMSFGIKGFFSGNTMSQLNSRASVGVYDAGYYNTQDLLQTLNELVDFERINDHNQTRLSLGAVNVLSGKMRYFDSQHDHISAANVMASGALPPAFPAIEVDGKPYWDGGIYSNTPVEAVMNDKPRRDSLIFSINLWHGEGDAPNSVWQAMGRAKDIQFASRADNYVKAERKLHHLRRIIRDLGDKMPASATKNKELQELLSWGCRTTMHLVRLNAPRLKTEDQSKDIDFSAHGIEERRKAGYNDMVKTLKDRCWENEHDLLDGIVVHD